MSKYESLPVPFSEHHGKRILTPKQLTENPYLVDFVKRFPACFHYNTTYDAWIFEPPEEAKMSNAPDNMFAVGINGHGILTLKIPPGPQLFLSKGEALNLAAYLIALADPAGTEFAHVLKAVQNT